MFYCDICEYLRKGSIFTSVIKKPLSCKFPPISNLSEYSAIRNWWLQEIFITNPRFKRLWIAFVFKITGRYRQILKDKYSSFCPCIFLNYLSTQDIQAEKEISNTEETVCHHCNHYRIDSVKRVTTKALVRFWGIRGKIKSPGDLHLCLLHYENIFKIWKNQCPLLFPCLRLSYAVLFAVKICRQLFQWAGSSDMFAVFSTPWCHQECSVVSGLWGCESLR